MIGLLVAAGSGLLAGWVLRGAYGMIRSRGKVWVVPQAGGVEAWRDGQYVNRRSTLVPGRLTGHPEEPRISTVAPKNQTIIDGKAFPHNG